MILKRFIPLMIVFVVGFITLISWFIPHEPFGSLEIHSTQWFDIIASFAMILGALNLLKLQGTKVLRRRKGWGYSAAAIISFFITLVFSFMLKGGYHVVIYDAGQNPEAVVSEIATTLEMPVGAATAQYGNPVEEGKIIQKYYYTMGSALELKSDLEAKGAHVAVQDIPWGGHLQGQGTYFNWLFTYVFTPLSATMFALLAFFVASASYRAFKIRNAEATVLLVAGVILMIGRVPLGHFLTSWFPSWLQWLHLPNLQEWIYQYPNVAGARAIMIGIALGLVGTSLRVILGIEKSFMGEK